MEVDIGIAPFRQVAAAPIKVPNRKLCKSYLRKGLEVAGEFEKKSKSLLHVCFKHHRKKTLDLPFGDFGTNLIVLVLLRRFSPVPSEEKVHKVELFR